MKSQFPKRRYGGFTLIELLVAMAITTLIVTVLVSITAVATDTWTRSRTQLRASRQAKTMVDAMANDFEAMVTRRNNKLEWLVAKHKLPENVAPLQSTNAAELVFFTAAMDRYNGDLGDAASKGDVCGVGYLLDYKNPIEGGTTGFPTFVLNRLVVNPDETFNDLLAIPELPIPADQDDPNKSVLFAKFFEGSDYRDKIKKTENFVCENVYQFTIVFHVEVPGKAQPVQIMIGADKATVFRHKGTGLGIVGDLPSGVTKDDLKAGRMVGVEISLTVLSDAAMNRIRKVGPPTEPAKLAKFLASNGYNYSKFIRLTSL